MHRKVCFCVGFFAISIAVTVMANQATATPVKLAVFGFELIDSSIQGEIEGQNEADRKRLLMIEEELKRQLGASGSLYDHRDGRCPRRGSGRRLSPWLDNGCEAKIAKELGADQALIGWVQKISNLILNLNVGIRDAENQQKIFAASVDIRGNTDESWRHGIRYLVKRRMFNDNSKIERD